MSTTPPIFFGQHGWKILGHEPSTRYRAARDILMTHHAMDRPNACAALDQAHLAYLNALAHPDIVLAAEKGGGFTYYCQDGHCAISRGHDSPGDASYNAMLHLAGTTHRHS